VRAAARRDVLTNEPAESASPEPLLTPLPEARGEDAVAGADALKAELTEQSVTIGSIIGRLDAVGITVSDTRFSLWSVLVVVLVTVGLLLFVRITIKLSHKLLRRFTGLTPSQTLLGEKLLSIVVWSFAFFIGIDLLGVDLTALTVFSGAFGLALGFGLQRTFGNLIAGIILLMDRSIKPGDVISVADTTGKETFGQIRKIGVRAVSVTTRDKREYLIPNENLMINQVENWSYSSREVRMQVLVRISYRCDVALAEKLMLEAARSCNRVLEIPPPTVWLSEFGESSLNFILHCWIVDPEEGVGNVRSEVLKKLWWLFKEHNIQVPFAQRDINLRDSDQFQQLVAALSERREPLQEPSAKPDRA
jgi:small-conductance mechanosensitive channel